MLPQTTPCPRRISTSPPRPPQTGHWARNGQATLPRSRSSRQLCGRPRDKRTTRGGASDAHRRRWSCRARTSIFKSGHGAVITSDDAFRLVREDAENRQKAAAEKEGRATKRADRKADKKALKQRNAELRADYTAKKKEWDEACAAIRAAHPGKKRLRLPPKPDYPFKKGSRVARDTQEGETGALEGREARPGSANGEEDEEESSDGENSSSEQNTDDDSDSDGMSYESEGL